MLKKKGKAKPARDKAKKPAVKELAPSELGKVSGGIDLTCHTIDNDPYAGLGFPAHPDPGQYRPCLSFKPTLPHKG
jgi:hypothetical protein